MPQDRFLYGRDAFAFVEALDGLSAVGEVIDALEREIAHFGFEALLLSGLDPEQQFDHQVLESRWPQEFLELYTRRHYVKCDPIARLCRQSAVPIEWSEASYANERNPRALEVMDTAAQFRLQRGFIVPIHGPNGYEACVAMDGVQIELPPGSKPALHLIALYAFNRVRQMVGVAKHGKTTLTPREREVLLWTAHGKVAWEVAEILHISTRTVNEYARSAFRKLGAANRTQAVAIALRDRLITL